jgi:hypothetical protein
VIAGRDEIFRNLPLTVSTSVTELALHFCNSASTARHGADDEPSPADEESPGAVHQHRRRGEWFRPCR